MCSSDLPMLISAPLAVKYRYWRSLLWMPTWFIFAFLRRLATLEAVISLPTRPLFGSATAPVVVPSVPTQQTRPAPTRH